MKNLLVLLSLILLSNLLFGHGKEVHKYIVREAWKLVEYQMPEMSQSPMKNWVGTDETIYYSKIVAGAYNEDEQDIIYMNCGWNFLTGCVMTTVNHFWDAEAGEYVSAR